jgi:uncharacterized protein YktB (UPF0637 family)
MIDNCASLLPNVVHSYLPISFFKVALFAMYLFVWLGFTVKKNQHYFKFFKSNIVKINT